MSSYDGLSNLMWLHLLHNMLFIYMLLGHQRIHSHSTSKDWLRCIFHSAAGRADDKCGGCQKQMQRLLHGWCFTKLSCQCLEWRPAMLGNRSVAFDALDAVVTRTGAALICQVVQIVQIIFRVVTFDAASDVCTSLRRQGLDFQIQLSVLPRPRICSTPVHVWEVHLRIEWWGKSSGAALFGWSSLF